jgi:indole-3-glycerol phosphate synthase
MPDVLEQIVEKTRERLKVQKRRLPLADLEKQLAGRKPARPFSSSLRRSDGLAVIAELKQASPSAGVIREETDLAGRIQAYARGGAAALSILTEEYFFHGSPYILEQARKATDLPILRKDFIVDSYQVEETRHMGADALLLITTLLPPSLLKELLDHTREVGLDALVETHDAADVEKALTAGATLIGINHRNLRTLQMDMTTAQRLLPIIPKEGRTIVVESGIKKPEEAERFRQLGAHAVLIGETLMRQADPEEAVRSFAQAGRSTKRKSA